MEGNKKIIKGEIEMAMIFAAGLGTRLKPWTERHPKALFPVNGKPLLQRNIEYLQSFGITRMVINVHHFASQIVDFLEEHHYFNCDIVVSYEKDEPLETGGGLKKAASFLAPYNPFIAINSDILSNLDISAMLQFHLRFRPLVTLAVTDRPSSRSFLFTKENQLCGWRNHKTSEQRITIPGSDNIPKAFSGIQIIDPVIFGLMFEEGKFSLVDLYLRLAANQSILGYEHSGDLLVDVGKPESVHIAEQYFQ